MGEIVVGVDGSAGAAHALQWAVAESAVRGADVVALMTWGYLDQRRRDGAEFEPGYDESDAARVLDVFVSDAIGESPVIVERRLRNDMPIPALLEAGRDAELLVLGARGLGGFRGLLLGSVSQACLHHAPCPVAIVREGASEEIVRSGRIVVGVDGSPGSRAALAWAVDEARLRHVPLEALHTWDWPQTVGYPLGVDLDPTLCRDGAQHLLDAELDLVVPGGSGPSIERTVLPANPASALIDISSDAGLVVVGTRGIGGFPGLLLGSVSHQVTQHAGCPVIVVPHPDRPGLTAGSSALP